MTDSSSIRTSLYNFKSITIIPSSTDLIDIILSRTQRRTPTQIHPNYAITRIREFYLRKIKTTQSNFHDKFAKMLEDFPRLEDIHPFYSELINVNYDRDNYKTALGNINRAKTLIDNVQRDYCRLMKYADSLYRAKQLKRAALGRMVTIVKRQKDTLQYLEDVRQHLSRMPSIDPNTRTVLVTGFPNVGKTSFVNSLSRVEAEVQPYAFTTKHLYIGHFQYNSMQWQIIDTPGILDKPLADRNPIEMLAITALAHLNAAIIYVMDLSQQCGHSIEEQVSLFQEIQPFFANKPLRIMLNKKDVTLYENLHEDEKEMIRKISDPTDFNQKRVPTFETSTLTKEGLIEIRNAICDDLLAQRVDSNLRNKSGAAKEKLMDRVRVAMPEKRDEVRRTAYIPENFKPKTKTVADDKVILGPMPKQQRYFTADSKSLKETERDLEEKFDYEYEVRIQKEWELRNPEEKWDIIPEIYKGHNIADFIDEDILEKLDALEAEEAERERTGFYDIDRESEDEDTLELRKLGQHIRVVKKKHILVSNRESKIGKAQVDRRAKKPGSAKDLKSKMEKMGLDLEHWKKDDNDNMEDDNGESAINAINRGRDRESRKRARSKSLATLQDKERALSTVRSQSRPAPRDKSGVRDESQAVVARKKAKKSLTKINQLSKRGEADRHIPDLKPKHLFSGKRGNGKTDRR